MSTENIASLDNLNDIIEPNLSLLPLAPGMIWLLITLFILSMILVFNWWKKYESQSYRREALKRLKQYKQNNEVTALPELLKRVAISAYGIDEVASLSGEQWLQYLNTTFGNKSFEQPLANILLRLPYQPKLIEELKQEQISALFVRCEQWITQHKVVS